MWAIFLGVVPLDELYKLNQILQEASQREQCLESKLIALQNVVEETKRSAEESWQAYVGEERLLSRLSALETKLQQARNNWSEDKLKEEIAKLQVYYINIGLRVNLIVQIFIGRQWEVSGGS